MISKPRQKPIRSDTEASVLRGQALSRKGYTALGYSRSKDVIDTKFILMHPTNVQQTSGQQNSMIRV